MALFESFEKEQRYPATSILEAKLWNFRVGLNVSHVKQ